MLLSCSIAMDSLNPSQLKSHFFRHNLISAEISCLVLFWGGDFSKTSNNSFDYWSDLCYHDCQVRVRLFKWTGISTWLFYSYLGWADITPGWKALGSLGRLPSLPQHISFSHDTSERSSEVSSRLAGVWTGRCVNYSDLEAGVLLFLAFYLVR